MKLDFRLNEWKNAHLPVVFGNFFIWSYIYSINAKEFYFQLSFLALISIALASFGFYLNDFFDKKQDIYSNKSNVASTHTTLQSVGILLILSFCLFILWYVFSKNTILLGLIGLEMLLLFLYSFPFVRLKEKPIWGVFSDALYAYFIPGIVVLLLIRDDFYLNLNKHHFFYFSWLLILGLRSILFHHHNDFFNDIKSGTVTTATKFGKTTVEVVVKILLAPLELAFFLFFIAYSSKIFLAVYLFFVVSINYRDNVADKLNSDNTLNEPLKLSQKLLNEFYLKWYALVVIIFLGLKNFLFFAVILPYVLIYFNFLKVLLKDIEGVFVRLFYFIMDVLRIIKSIYLFIYYRIYSVASIIVNYSLYYGFLLFGIDLKERAARKNQMGNLKLTDIKQGDIIDVKSEKNELSDQSFFERPVVYSCLFERNVHGLWIGSELSPIELLTIKSFIKNGYQFHLWLYENLQTILPEGCIVCDANEILSSDKVFSYKNTSQYGIGKGSYAGFSDIFRYKLLYDKGGWWVDMDVTSIKPFDVKEDYFFRPHHNLPLVGNIMKAPQNSSLMYECYIEAMEKVNEDNTDWHKPIEILIKNVYKHNLEKYVVSGVCNTDEWHVIKPFIDSQADIPEDWFAIHWCNESWNTNGFNKHNLKYKSTLGSLLLAHNIMPKLSKTSAIKMDLMFSVKNFVVKSLKVL